MVVIVVKPSRFRLIVADELFDGAIAVFILDLAEIGFEVADPAGSRKIFVAVPLRANHPIPGPYNPARFAASTVVRASVPLFPRASTRLNGLRDGLTSFSVGPFLSCHLFPVCFRRFNFS
jgi:hypothetical protein